MVSGRPACWRWATVVT